MRAIGALDGLTLIRFFFQEVLLNNVTHHVFRNFSPCDFSSEKQCKSATENLHLKFLKHALRVKLQIN